MKRLPAIVFLMIFVNTATHSAEKIAVWTYYSTPPFSINTEKTDITSFLAKHLTRESGGKWVFEAQTLPRKRLNSYLAENQQGIVVWANPLWFKDKEEQMYDWTERVVWGSNEIVSLQTHPVPYDSAESLAGKRFGGVGGHHYVGIDELVASGKIERLDTSSFEQNFQKLINRRLDVILLPRGELFYLMKKHQLEDHIYIAQNPHQKYPRKILVTKQLKGVRDFINSQLTLLRSDPDWLLLLDNAGIKQ